MPAPVPRRFAIATVLMFGVMLLGGTSPGNSSTLTTSSQSFAVAADAEVNASHPNSNYGGASKLHTDASPIKQSFLRFDVTGLTGPVVAARLQIYPTSNQSIGFTVHPVLANSWGERTLTYANEPPFAAGIGSSGRVYTGKWTTVDVSSVVVGNGTYSFQIDTPSTTNLALASREAGAATAASLVVDTVDTDTTPPTAPTDLLVTGATTTTVALGWTASTDNVGVARYDVSVDGATTGSTQATIYTVGGLSCGTTHTVGITAYDAAGNPSPTTTATAATSACSPLVDIQPSFPIRAAFYYPWYPETWTVGGMYPHYSPSLGYYDSANTSAISSHLDAMQYANLQVGIASWWGQGTKTDLRFRTLLSTTTLASSTFRWAVYYEQEGSSNPAVSQLTADLTAIQSNYGSDPSYLRINGRFVVFVYADALDGCAMADRWKQANTVNAYIVLKVFSGYRTCLSQPDGWHQYAPAVATDSQAGYSYSISPGFYKANETAPRLARDLTRWGQNVRDMVASKAPFQLVTTFNEWGEGTPVESAVDWSSPSGYGLYLDVLHDNGQGSSTPPDTTPPSQPTNPSVTGATQTSLSLGWTASTDNVGVAGYNVYVGGVKTGSTGSPTYSLAGLTCGTAYTLAVEAYDAAGNLSTRASVNGSTSACSPPPPTGDPMIAAAGDIACDPADGSFNAGNGTTANCRQKYTSDLLVNLNPTAVLTLGDNQYEDNAYSKYVAAGAYDSTWGRLKSILYPGIGNHEYLTSGGAGYCQYFGASAHCNGSGLATNAAYYSFDVGSWHMIALNSQCSEAGGCGAGSPQETWLKNDLAAHPNQCVLAYWHHPRWSSGQHGSNSSYGTFWTDLYNARADLVLNGHDHDYERFTPQNPSGQPDATNGIREFVVGTGGKNHYGFTTVQPNSEVRNSTTYGVLKLTLHSNGYDWQFVNDPNSGSFTDSGSGTCH